MPAAFSELNETKNEVRLIQFVVSDITPLSGDLLFFN